MDIFDWTYLPAAGYLAVVSILVLVARRCPTWVHPVALIVGVAVRAAQEPAWTDALVPVAVAAGLFVLLVFLTARLLSGVSLFAMVTALALLPFGGWPALVVGIFLSAAVGTWRTWRSLGGERVTMLTYETMGAMGVHPGGAFGRPDGTRLLKREKAVDVSAETTTARRLRIHLPPYLLVGVLVGALVSATSL